MVAGRGQRATRKNKANIVIKNPHFVLSSLTINCPVISHSKFCSMNYFVLNFSNVSEDGLLPAKKGVFVRA